MNDVSRPDGRAEATEAAGPVPVRPWVILRYDTRRFPFAALLSQHVFNVRRLDALHEVLKARRRLLGLPERVTPQDNLAIRQLVQVLPEEAPFFRLYHSFMVRVLAPLVGRGLSYSRRPKMRVHFPGTGSVSSFHHDVTVTKRCEQVNFWMPFTDVQDTATLWCESSYGRGDYAPIPVRYGEVLLFDGGYLGHGSMPNCSCTTRISLDMRFSLKGAQTRAEGVALMNFLIARLTLQRSGDL